MSKAQLAARVTPPNAALLRLPSGASSLASLSGLAGDTILGVCNRCHKDLMLADLASPWPDLERSEWALKSYELLLPSPTATSPTTTTTTTTEAPASLCSTTMDDATGRGSPRHDEHRAEPEELLILQTPDNALLSSHELDSPLVHSQDSDDGEFVVVRRKSNWERAQFHTRIRFLATAPKMQVAQFGPVCYRAHEQLETEIDQVQQDIDRYSAAIAQLDQKEANAQSASMREASQQFLEQLEQRELALHRRLGELYLEHNINMARTNDIKLQRTELDQQEAALVEAQQALEQQLLELHEAIEVSAQASRELKYQIDTLPHVIDMIFDIQLPQLSTGACYINGFRFGPILNQWVKDTNLQWEEVNAAWGEATLALYTVSKRVGVSMGEYRISPQGVSSVIEHPSLGVTYELFGKQVLFGFGVAEKNAKAMRAFLLCLQTLTQAIEAREGARIVDYSMQGGSIGGLPFNELTQNLTIRKWHHVTYCMLSNLKCLAAWIADSESACARCLDRE